MPQLEHSRALFVEGKESLFAVFRARASLSLGYGRAISFFVRLVGWIAKRVFGGAPRAAWISRGRRR
jgi:hypothetical protein